MAEKILKQTTGNSKIQFEIVRKQEMNEQGKK